MLEYFFSNVFKLCPSAPVESWKTIPRTLSFLLDYNHNYISLNERFENFFLFTLDTHQTTASTAP